MPDDCRRAAPIEHTLRRVFGGEPIGEDGTVSGYFVEILVADALVYRNTFAFCGSVELALAHLGRVLSENILLGSGLAPRTHATVHLTPTRVVVDSSRSTPGSVSNA